VVTLEGPVCPIVIDAVAGGALAASNRAATADTSDTSHHLNLPRFGRGVNTEGEPISARVRSMPSTIHFTSGEAVTVTTDAKDVVDQLGKAKKFTRFQLVPIPVFEVYVASDEVAYVASIPTAAEFAAWLRDQKLD
jgi:hypothetical protein